MPNEKRKKAYDFSDISRGYKDETSSRRFMYFNLKFLRNRIYFNLKYRGQSAISILIVIKRLVTRYSELYSEPSRQSKMKPFVETGFFPLNLSRAIRFWLSHVL